MSASEASDTYVFLVASVRLGYNAYSTCVSVISFIPHIVLYSCLRKASTVNMKKTRKKQKLKQSVYHVMYMLFCV